MRNTPPCSRRWQNPSPIPPPQGPPPADATAEPSVDQIKQYRTLSIRQDSLLKKEQELLTFFREDNPRVKDVRTQLTEVETLKKNLEDSFPRLAHTIVPVSTQPGAFVGGIDVAAEKARLGALEAKIKVLTSQLETAKTEAANLDLNEASILQLMRERDLAETNYRNYSTNLKNASNQ